MREGRLDRITDKLKGRFNRISTKIHLQNSGTNPYRQKPISVEERMESYAEWAGTPIEMELRQEYGDAEIDNIHLNMQRLIERQREYKWR